jgi:hypothetical protein
MDSSGPSRPSRLRGLLRSVRLPGRGARTGPVLADDGTLTVVGSSFDPARADSAVVGEMEAAGVDLAGPLLLRHHLRLPDQLAAEEARRIVAQEGYVLVAEGADGDVLRVRVSRPQRVTGLAVAQERSRMAGLARRLGGDADGWDVLAAR